MRGRRKRGGGGKRSRGRERIEGNKKEEHHLNQTASLVPQLQFTSNF